MLGFKEGINNKNMNKVSITLLISILLTFPVSTFAVIQTLNGQTGQTQTFANDTNVRISSSGNTHTLNWNGVLAPNRGGTGSNLFSFSTSSILIWNGSSIIGDSSYQWDNNKKFLHITGGSYPQIIITNSSALDNLKNFFASTTEDGSLIFGAANDALTTFDPIINISNQSGGSGEEFGRIIIGTTTEPQVAAKLYVVNNISNPINPGLVIQRAAYSNQATISFFNEETLASPILGATIGLKSGDYTEDPANTDDLIIKNRQDRAILFLAGQRGTSEDPIAKQLMKLSYGATTTISFGDIGDSQSKVCYNTKNTDGNDISFYFVGTSMVIENNICR